MISLSDQNWMDIEKAYGQNLSIEIRQHIFDITNSFARFATIEQNAPPLSEAQQRLETLRQAAKSMINVLDHRSSSVAIEYTDDLIAKWFNNQLITIPLSQGADLNFEVLTYILGSLVSACEAAGKELEFWSTKTVWKEGMAWKRWVTALTHLLDRHGLPIAAWVDDDDKLSPFVAFVRELQRSIPSQYRNSTQSDGALRKAIQRARESTPWDTND
jgi:hypothetical protein